MYKNKKTKTQNYSWKWCHESICSGGRRGVVRRSPAHSPETELLALNKQTKNNVSNKPINMLSECSIGSRWKQKKTTFFLLQIHPYKQRSPKVLYAKFCYKHNNLAKSKTDQITLYQWNQNFPLDWFYMLMWPFFKPSTIPKLVKAGKARQRLSIDSRYHNKTKLNDLTYKAKS